VRREEIGEVMTELKGGIKERDLENLAVVRYMNLQHLVSYDFDYPKARVKEYTTPKSFVKLFDLEPFKTEY